MGKIRMNPVDDVREALLDSFLATLDAIREDAEHCVRAYNSWQRRYGADNADIKQEVKQSVDEMETAFRTYRTGIADKKQQLQPAPAPAVGIPGSVSTDQLLRHLQLDSKLQITELEIQVQGAMTKLFEEVTVANWEKTEDDEVKKAMRKVEGWSSRKLKVDESFLKYKAMIKTYQADQMEAAERG